jgi:hypothetical protein
MTTQVDLANRALAEIGTRSQLTGSIIDPTQSVEARYASLLYAPLRDFLLRDGDYDWAAQIASAGSSVGAPLPWSYAYGYPAGAIRIRQLVPANIVDPQPILWDVMNVGGARKILTLDQVTTVVYTAAPSEDLWDAIYTEAFIRLLGSALAFALENRIEASQVKLNEAISFAGIANLRDS